jgi:hypothetical protein
MFTCRSYANGNYNANGYREDGICRIFIETVYMNKNDIAYNYQTIVRGRDEFTSTTRIRSNRPPAQFFLPIRKALLRLFGVKFRPDRYPK